MKSGIIQALLMVSSLYIHNFKLFAQYVFVVFGNIFDFILHNFLFLVGADIGEKGEGSDITCCEEGGRRPIAKEIRHPDCFEVEIPRNDPFYSRIRQTCMEFVRSMPAERPECNLGPREQVIYKLKSAFCT